MSGSPIDGAYAGAGGAGKTKFIYRNILLNA